MKPFTSNEHAVIAGDRIYAKLSRQAWDDRVADLTAQIGKHMEGIVAALEKCGATLARLSPKPLGEDERPNHLIVLDAAKVT